MNNLAVTVYLHLLHRCYGLLHPLCPCSKIWFLWLMVNLFWILLSHVVESALFLLLHLVKAVCKKLKFVTSEWQFHISHCTTIQQSKSWTLPSKFYHNVTNYYYWCFGLYDQYSLLVHIQTFASTAFILEPPKFWNDSCDQNTENALIDCDDDFTCTWLLQLCICEYVWMHQRRNRLCPISEHLGAFKSTYILKKKSGHSNKPSIQNQQPQTIFSHLTQLPTPSLLPLTSTVGLVSGILLAPASPAPNTAVPWYEPDRRTSDQIPQGYYTH